MSSFSKQEEQESVVRAWVGRPAEPERILEEFPDLTVTDYLRYRVSGCLPDDIELALKEGAKRFISEGEKSLAHARFPKREEQAELRTDDVHLTEEEIRERLTHSLMQFQNFLSEDSDSISVPIAIAKDLVTIREAVLSSTMTFDRFDDHEKFAALVRGAIRRGSISPVHKAGLILLNRHLNHTTPYYELQEELVNGNFETLVVAMQSAELSESVVSALCQECARLDASQSKRTFTELLPALRESGEECIRRAVCYDNTLGSFSSLISQAVGTLSSADIKAMSEPIEEAVGLLVDQGIVFLEKGSFLCHYNAVAMLETLREVHVRQNISPQDPKKLDRLLGLIRKNKIEGYRSAYPRVSTLKNLMRSISNGVRNLETVEQKVSITIGDRFRYWLGKINLSRG